MSLKRFNAIAKAFNLNSFRDLGETELIETDEVSTVIFTVTPYEGIHQNKKYTVTLKFQEADSWPGVYIDSEIYDQIKTSDYLQNRGFRGSPHKGICIKDLSYAYSFAKNFKEKCGNEWKNYIYNLMVVFNNLQDFEKGNGLKSAYKNILHL